MIIVNTLESRSFGPFASATGFFLFAGGLIFTCFNLSGLIIAVVGAFIAFTSTRTIIDTEKRRIRHADFLFGIWPYGKWIKIQTGMKLRIKTVNRGYRGYIRGTQPVDIRYRDARIFIFNHENKQVMPLKKFKDFQSAEAELKYFESMLGLEGSDHSHQ